jgi:hypothetical protein
MCASRLSPTLRYVNGSAIYKAVESGTNEARCKIGASQEEMDPENKIQESVAMQLASAST